MSARGEGQLDEDNGGCSTGVTFGGFLGQEMHQWQQAPLTHHSHGLGCIPNLCLEPLWQPLSPGQGCPAPITASCPVQSWHWDSPGGCGCLVLPGPCAARRGGQQEVQS